MRRVIIIGTPGAGKTTFGKVLAAELRAVFIELDALHWHADWTPAPDFAEQVERALQAERWVVDGNYRKVQPFILDRADTVLWLDYSFGIKLWRLFLRTCRRTFTRETLWNGNTEGVRNFLPGPNSIFVWFFKMHWQQRKRYGTLFADAPPHLTLYRLYAPEEADKVLARAAANTSV